MDRTSNIVVLISCMHENAQEVIKKTNLETDVVVINQCDIDSEEELSFLDGKGNSHRAIIVHTTERGLSKSRNMAIRKAEVYGICLVCDDDEVLTAGYEERITDAYQKLSGAQVIAFSISCDQYTRTYSQVDKKLGFVEILKTSSQQISFKRNDVVSKGICFDEKMGSGTGNGGGEENKFLLSCRKAELNMYYHPFCVATIYKGDSKWFKGYTEQFFQNQGWTDRRLLGPFLGFVYIFYWSIFRRCEYKKDGISLYKALKNSLKGYFSKR